nr:hypothetical protein [Tanacetum cinerariifolium]
MLFLVWSFGSKNPYNIDDDAAFGGKKPKFEGRKHESEVHVSPSSSAQIKKHDDKTKREAKGKSHVESSTGYRNLNAKFKDFSDNNINEVNAVDSPVPAVGPIPITRVHKDHLVKQIIGDLSLATQTRSMTRVAKDQGTKWVFRNKKDERGIVVRNKARLVAQGHTQEDGIDYEEVFAPVARIEAIRLFLAYASLMGFMVYKMDIKSDFMYGTIKEEVYVCQPPGIKDPYYPDKVYKVVKALYGLHKLLELDLCKAFEKLMKDKFQMSSMSGLTFFLVLQVKHKPDGMCISQDKYVAEILRKFGLTDRKSASTPIDTKKPLLKILMVKQKMYGIFISQDTYVAEILRKFRLTEGESASTPIDTEKPLLKDPDGEDCKKQIVVATSSTEAEYVAAASCCTQVNDVTMLQALVDRKKMVITEAAIREVLRLDDAKGVDCLPNKEIFAELARMGYEKPSTKLTFYKTFFSSQWKFLIHTILQSLSAKYTSWNEFSSAMAFAVICLSTGRKFNFSKYIFDSLVRNVDRTSKFYMYPRFIQLLIKNQIGDRSTHTTKYTSPVLIQKVFANMRKVGKGFLEVDTPLFKGIIVEQVIKEGGAEGEHVEEDIAAQGDDTTS